MVKKFYGTVLGRESPSTTHIYLEADLA